MTKVKIFYGESDYKLERDINEWVRDNRVEVISVSFTAYMVGYTSRSKALVTYKETGGYRRGY